MITYKQCDQTNKSGEHNVTIAADNVCHGAAQTEECEKGGGKCVTDVDGYYTESFICCAFGFLWLGLWGGFFSDNFGFLIGLNEQKIKINSRLDNGVLLCI